MAEQELYGIKKWKLGTYSIDQVGCFQYQNNCCDRSGSGFYSPFLRPSFMILTVTCNCPTCRMVCSAE
jgi:hypothetical protein